jgi:hypothetical protein
MNGNGTATLAKSQKPHKAQITVTKLTVMVHPDQIDDFTDQLELLCRKFAGANYTLDWREN